MAAILRQRQNIRVLGEEYLNGNKKPLSDIIRAWQGIQNKDVTDPDSFFMIAGYHGEPFRGAGWGNPQWWGGYCNHGNVLFPTWHRAYLYRLENALRSVPGCENVALPYWDETEIQSSTDGIPWVFLQRTIELDTGGPPVQNPLYSYMFQLQVWDNVGSPQTNGDYYKSKGYVTKRFPFCGFDGQVSGDPVTQQAVDDYNTWITQHGDVAINGALNANVTDWIKPSTAIESIGIAAKYAKCLKAPNYTVFSNTTSATQYNEVTLNVQGSTLNDQGRTGNPEAFVPLESPHNDMHLAVGGFNLNNFSANIVQNFFNGANKTLTLANGDMGENNTASFDPIFFFHHCFVDKVFWDWQKLHDATKALEIIEGYPGTNSVDNQGPTPGVAGGTWLTLDSPLAPFKQGDARTGPAMTSNDVIDIEGQLGYTYDEGLQAPKPDLPQITAPVKHHAQISGVNRAAIGGSFLIQVHKHQPDGSKQLLGFESVLSRWQTSGCANCQNHLNVKAYIPLPGVTDDDVADGKITASITPRQNADGKLMVGGGGVPQVVPRILKTAPTATATATA